MKCYDKLVYELYGERLWNTIPSYQKEGRPGLSTVDLATEILEKLKIG